MTPLAICGNVTNGGIFRAKLHLRTLRIVKFAPKIWRTDFYVIYEIYSLQNDFPLFPDFDFVGDMIEIDDE